MCLKKITVAGIAAFLGGLSLQVFADSKTEPFTTPVERCILPAADYHGVNAHILRAILRVESRLNPETVSKNDNGSVDVGIGGMNSRNFKELAKFGIGPEHLRDGCIGTYVAAWHLKKGMAAKGNTWEAIARYHSSTPYFNKRYQILLYNDLVRSNVIAGVIQPVPPLRPSAIPIADKVWVGESDRSRHASLSTEDSQVMVFDQVHQ